MVSQQTTHGPASHPCNTIVTNDTKYYKGYQVNHKRVSQSRGRASNHTCERCDSQAKEWAHIHDTDPTDVNNYIPLCKSCHSNYDIHRKDKRTLSDDQVREIRKAAKANESYASIGKRFGITGENASKIARLVIYKNVQD